VYIKSGSRIDTSISFSTGKKYITVKAWDSKGYTQSKSLTIYVSGTSSPSTGSTGTTTMPSGAKVHSNIDEKTGWDHCDVCSGPGGDGHTTPYYMKQFVSSPSLDGKSAMFFLGGTDPYASALWWKQLGGTNAKHFIYDLYFYVKDPGASQALEFDVNQSINGRMYIFGTECNFRNTGTWRVWDTTYKWVNTGIPCPLPKAYTWNHLVWEFERVDNKVRYVSVTLNGKKHYVNRYQASKYKSAYELNAAFQMDGNGQMVDYFAWLDKVKLIYW
jgi:hypothetical protein